MKNLNKMFFFAAALFVGVCNLNAMKNIEEDKKIDKNTCQISLSIVDICPFAEYKWIFLQYTTPDGREIVTQFHGDTINMLNVRDLKIQEKTPVKIIFIFKPRYVEKSISQSLNILSKGVFTIPVVDIKNGGKYFFVEITRENLSGTLVLALNDTVCSYVSEITKDCTLWEQELNDGTLEKKMNKELESKK